VCCGVMQCVAVSCSGCTRLILFQHTATHYKARQHTATHCYTLLHTASHCNTLQHTATHYNTPQYTATHCNTLQHIMVHPTKAVLSVVCACYTSIRRVVRASEAHEICMCIVCYSVLQRVALCCGCTHDTVYIHTTPSLCRMHIFTV